MSWPDDGLSILKALLCAQLQAGRAFHSPVKLQRVELGCYDNVKNIIASWKGRHMS